MLRKDDSATKPPKIRAKAAETRGLVGFAVELADNLLSDHMAHERAHNEDVSEMHGAMLLEP